MANVRRAKWAVQAGQYRKGIQALTSAKIKASVERLHDPRWRPLSSVHCLSLLKFIFALRTCPPNFITRSTASFDDVMREALANIAGGPLSDWSWQKATLPSSLGGLKLRLANLHAPAAWQLRYWVSPPLLSAAITSLAHGAAK